MRDRLTELIDDFREMDAPSDGRSWTEHLADHLLAGGVIVQAHGYWKLKGVLIKATGAKNYTCSVCGKENFHTTFCSECGAKMDAERSNENAE